MREWRSATFANKRLRGCGKKQHIGDKCDEVSMGGIPKWESK